MPFLKVKNNAESTLAFGINAGATSLTVASGGGAKFPTDNFHISIDDEVLLCTSRTDDTFTVQRGKEGTAPAAHSQGAKVQLRWTAAYIEELQTALLPHQGPFLLVVQNTSQTMNANAWTQVQFHQVKIDTHNAWDSNNHRFICPVAGYYLIMGRASVQNIPDGNRIAVGAYINGSENEGGRLYDTWVGGTGNVAGSGGAFRYLNQGDYVQLWLYHSHTSHLQTVGAARTDALIVVRIA